MGEKSIPRSTIDGEARLDIRASGFWRLGLSAYANSARALTPIQIYQSMKWKRNYETITNRMMNIKLEPFMIFSCTGGDGQ